MEMKWLITGGCGFIGTNLIKKLLQETRHSVRVYDNLSTSSINDLSEICGISNIQKNIEDYDQWVPLSADSCQIIIDDIRNKNALLRATKGADVIVHLAANTGVPQSIQDPVLDCEVNINGTLNLLECAKSNNVQKFIFASSGAPLGGALPPICETTLPAPLSPYGVSKLSGESYCSVYHNLFNISTVALRFGNVYGPGSQNKSSVVAKFIKQILAGQEIEIYGAGNQTRDYIFIDDLIDALILSAYSEKSGGEIFQIATNKETSLIELTQALSLAFEKFGVLDIASTHSSARSGDAMRNFSDISKAKEVLLWTPKTDLVNGLVKTIEYFLDRANKT